MAEGQGSRPLALLHSLRRSLAGALDASLPEPHTSFAKAVLLGIRDTMPSDVVEAFRNTGTSHLLAISGLHVGVVLGLVLPAAAGSVRQETEPISFTSAGSYLAIRPSQRPIAFSGARRNHGQSSNWPR